MLKEAGFYLSRGLMWMATGIPWWSIAFEVSLIPSLGDTVTR